MGICGQEYKRKQYLEKREKQTKIKINTIKVEITILENEVDTLNEIIKRNIGATNGGNMSMNKKKEEMKNLFKKIKKLNQLKLIRNKLETNLEKIEELKLHKKYNEEIAANNILFEYNKISDKEIDKNNELIYKLNNESEELYRKYKEGEEMLDDGMNEFEIEQKIKEYFNSQK
jgi:hypothetical protein